MRIELKDRTEETVREYFEKSKQPYIKENLPQKAQTVEEAIEDYRKTLLASATSFGQTIRVEGRYIGDIWCYCINMNDIPNAMLSYCIFDKEFLNRGIASESVRIFLNVVAEKYRISSVGAITYLMNVASIKVLEKNGFVLEEEFEENGTKSRYYQRNFT
jgi:RimJ/RimL family protein N-acetyltransferase